MNAFPAGTPNSLHDPTIIRDYDWQAFQALDTMTSHWTRPEWPDGQRSWHWMLILDTPAVVGLAHRCQQVVSHPAFTSVPLDGLHITLGRLAFVHEVPLSTVDRVVEVAQARCAHMPSFGLEVGPLAGSRGALRLSVAPWAPLLTLHRALAETCAEVLGARAVMDTSSFRPHLSLAYAHEPVPITELQATVTGLRELPPASLVVQEAALVDLRRKHRTYQHTVLARITLGPPA